MAFSMTDEKMTEAMGSELVQLAGGVASAAAENSPRARAPRTPPEVVRERVYRIALLIAGGEWNDAERYGLCDEWGITQQEVNKLASKASLIVDYTTGDREKLANIVRVRLRKIGEDDGNDRVQAYRVLLESIGEMKRVNRIEGPGGGPIQLQALPADPMDQAARVDALILAMPEELLEGLARNWERVCAAVEELRAESRLLEKE